jgi:AraC family transcriptional regulator, transcriptional activator of pobA
MTSASALPIFYLYGEPHRAVDDAFVHVESLDDSSRPSEWTIRPHRHIALGHIFTVISGGGLLQLDDSEVSFTAPCLLIVPAGTSHGFRWQQSSAGFVLTVASDHLRSLGERYADLRPLFRDATLIPLPPRDLPSVEKWIGGMMREYSWGAPGRRAAIDAALLDIMVTALRLMATEAALTEPKVGRQAGLVARLRQRIEERYRLHEPIAAHAKALGVTPFQLRAACNEIARASPSEMIEQRIMLEARRALRYSTLSISELALSLGFTDTAYFSRFFSRHAGVSPRAFRNGTRAPP